MRYPLMKNNILREDLDAVIQHLSKNDPRLTQGDNVLMFEREWSEWLGVKYSVFVNSGASANLLSMALLKDRYPDGGEVIVPPLTWVSDIASVLQNGFTPIFADINPRTLSMDEDRILSAITSETKAVFLTHAQGFSGLTDKLLIELDARKIPLIEDVCESHGATHKNAKLGSFGWMSNFSFYYAHHLSTIEGGMVCTNDPEVYQKLLALRSHGMVREMSDSTLKKDFISANPGLNPEFIFLYPAYNVRNTEIGCILGRSQLSRLDENVKRRTHNLKLFISLLDSSIFRTDFHLTGSSNYAFNLILKEADVTVANRLKLLMEKEGIEYRQGSAGGGNQLRQPYLRGIIPDDHYMKFPETEHIHKFGFYIGNYPTMTDRQIREICNIVNKVSGD